MTVKDDGRTALDESMLNQLHEVEQAIRLRLGLPMVQDYGFSEIRLKADRDTTYAGQGPVTFRFSAEFSVNSYGALECKFGQDHEGGDGPPSRACKVKPGLNRFEESRTVGEPGKNFRGFEYFRLSDRSERKDSSLPIELSCR